MLTELFPHISYILASQSPRRKELLSSLDVDFDVVVKSIDETVSNAILASEAAEYIALKKLDAFLDVDSSSTVVITADTVVVDKHNNVLGKPKNEEEALLVIESLCSGSHDVYTGVGIFFRGIKHSFSSHTKVFFNSLTANEIRYYVTKYKPYDKAGSYGIQEWIGRIGVFKIEGSYENVMGLPTAQLYEKLKDILTKEAL